MTSCVAGTNGRRYIFFSCKTASGRCNQNWTQSSSKRQQWKAGRQFETTMTRYGDSDEIRWKLQDPTSMTTQKLWFLCEVKNKVGEEFAECIRNMLQSCTCTHRPYSAAFRCKAEPYARSLKRLRVLSKYGCPGSSSQLLTQSSRAFLMSGCSKPHGSSDSINISWSPPDIFSSGAWVQQPTDVETSPSFFPALQLQGLCFVLKGDHEFLHLTHTSHP